MRSERDGPRAGPGLRLAAAGGMAFLHLPLLVIVLYAFSMEEKSFRFPIPGFTTKWFSVAFAREDIRAARFSGDTGFVVTFKKTDPLFVLDLADPTAPAVRGAGRS
jgi:ABC-type spermidine/putrescine transport system permease subunit II